MPHQARRRFPLACLVQVPVVCAVRGRAAGLGFQIARAADFTVATDDARFWEPLTERGFTPDGGTTWLLARKAGAVRARDLLLRGRKLTGAEAADGGPDPCRGGRSRARRHRRRSGRRVGRGSHTVAIGLTKWLLHEAEAGTLDDTLRREAFALELSSRSEDFREGLLVAFKDERQPDFRGR